MIYIISHKIYTYMKIKLTKLYTIMTVKICNKSKKINQSNCEVKPTLKIE